MNFETKEYTEGWKACEDGVSFNDNPYSENTKEGEDWAKGYDDCAGDYTE